MLMADAAVTVTTAADTPDLLHNRPLKRLAPAGAPDLVTDVFASLSFMLQVTEDNVLGDDGGDDFVVDVRLDSR